MNTYYIKFHNVSNLESKFHQAAFITQRKCINYFSDCVSIVLRIIINEFESIHQQITLPNITILKLNVNGQVNKDARLTT